MSKLIGPDWDELNTPKDVLEALYRYMDANADYGAMDSEPPYAVRDALERLTSFWSWQLYSGMFGVNIVNGQISTAVGRAVELYTGMGFDDGEALARMWGKIAHV